MEEEPDTNVNIAELQAPPSPGLIKFTFMVTGILGAKLIIKCLEVASNFVLLNTLQIGFVGPHQHHRDKLQKACCRLGQTRCSVWIWDTTEDKRRPPGRMRPGMPGAWAGQTCLSALPHARYAHH